LYTGGRARSVSGRGSEVAIATAHGVEYSTGGAFQAYGKENAGLVFEEATAIGFDANGKLWVGTRAGMARLTSGVFQNFTGPQKSVMGSSLVDIPPSPSNCQLIGNNIKVIQPYGGMLAIGTTSGLCITDMEGTWRNYYATHKDWAQSAGKIIQQTVSGNSPLPGNNVFSLASSENDELLFVGTKKGLAILNGNSWIDTTVMLKNLPSTSISGLAYLNGDLWVGTMNGVYQVKDVASLIKKTDK
jgi:ligand-binding sensor domain-containing protein